MILLGWVLWHINHCKIFNAKSSLYIYIKYTRFGLVGFYGISTLVFNDVSCSYIYTKFICFVNEQFVGNNFYMHQDSFVT